jgi:hypothetical protein
MAGTGNMTSQPYPPLAQMKTVFRVSAKYSSKSANASTKEGTSEYDKAAFHSRRSHTKSRNGCVNCKRRRVKVSKQPTASIRQDCLVEVQSDRRWLARSATRQNLGVRDVRTETQTANTRPSLHHRIQDWSKDSFPRDG